MSRFDPSKPGEQRYPIDAVPSGSRSRFDDGVAPAHRDEELRSAIFTALRGAQIDVSKLEVMVAGGVVTLTGTVEDGPSLSLAEDRVEHIAGVDEVRNEIMVEGH